MNALIEFGLCVPKYNFAKFKLTDGFLKPKLTKLTRIGHSS